MGRTKCSQAGRGGYAAVRACKQMSGYAALISYVEQSDLFCHWLIVTAIMSQFALVCVYVRPTGPSGALNFKNCECLV